MDRWRFFAIGHRDHEILNPMSDATLDRLIEVLDLPAGSRVLDLGCGKAELLIRLGRHRRCTGTGVDLSESFAADARTRVADAGLAGSIEIVHGDAARFDAAPGAYAACVCLGASWIFEGYAGTLRALSQATSDDGLVVVGEPYWRTDPPDAYLDAIGLEASGFGSHEGNVRTGLDLGLGLLHTFVSSRHDFDRYEGLQWNAIERYARSHPEDPDAKPLVARIRAERDAYLRWGREVLGWAIYVFAKRAFDARAA